MDDRIYKAIEIAFKYGMIDGAHHKMWVIDQMLRILLSSDYDQDDQYNKRVKRENAENPDHDPWDVGIAPCHGNDDDIENNFI
jgi:hypothetical protein